MARQARRYFVAAEEFGISDVVGLIWDLPSAGWGLDQLGCLSAATGTTGTDAVPFSGLAALVVERHTVDTQNDGGGTFGAAAP